MVWIVTRINEQKNKTDLCFISYNSRGFGHCTFSYGDSDPERLYETLTAQYKTISDYMAANKLVINADKTHLIVMGTKATAKRSGEVILQADQHVIAPSRTEKLLGGSHVWGS